MRKRSLMLTTAAVALMSGAAYADTTVDSSKTDHYTTGALATSSDTGTANAGNITVKSGGSIAPSGATQAAITVNTNNWVLNQGVISNKDKDGAHGIRIDLSADRDLSGASFTNAASATVTGVGIYLDSASSLTLSGSGTGKYAIFLDGAGCTVAACTYKGDITAVTGSSISVTGDNSDGVYIGSKAILQGNLNLGGTMAVTAATTTNTSTNNYGVLSLGQITGNINVGTGSSMAVQGHGARGISIQGTGVTGSITIGGAVTTSKPTVLTTNINQKVNTTTNPEGGPALEVGASVGGGISILGATSSGTGTVSVAGTGPAILISPSVNSLVSTSSAPAGPLNIGIYSDSVDPGFSFYNRGTVTIMPNNYNDAATAMGVAGYDASHPTILAGGLFNSGSMSASIVTSGANQSTNNSYAVGVAIGGYSQLGAGSGKNPGDQAAFVNMASGTNGGTISASVSGSRGGAAYGVTIAATASVPSIINTGNIVAVAGTTDKTLTGNVGTSPTNPLVAVAILDQSGTLTSILNQGTIHGAAGYQATSTSTPTPLDNNSQIATAIDLRGGTATTPSATGVTILNHASSSRAAVISGDIFFGTGNNQVLDLLGIGASLPATVTGNVTYGMIATGSSSGDVLHIGQYSALSGQVTTLEGVRGAGVQVNVDTHGSLTLLNTGTSLNSTTFTVANGGQVNLGVNESLTASGGVVAAQSVTFQSGSVINAAYASFVPASEHQFVLMTADSGQLQIDPTTLSVFNSSANSHFLLANATMCVTSNPACTRPSGLLSSLDALILDVTPKTASELGLTAGSVVTEAAPTVGGTPTTLFDQVNNALAVDDVLGSAMINGIHNSAEAQKAYAAFAPNITGATRAIVISITDQATGIVGARQRMLNMYGKTEGGMTLWGQEFAQMIKDPGNGVTDPNTLVKVNPGFKDHGFGFAIGVDGGSPKYGWYGGAFTFYAGDVSELANSAATTTVGSSEVGRNSHGNQQWYLLSLYSVWRGKGLFLDTKLDAGYGHIDGKRSITLIDPAIGVYVREADNKHAGALVSGGINTGAMLSYGAFTFTPHMSLDGLYMREEGYTEHNPNTTTVGDAFDLKVQPYYAKSLRAFAGLDVRYDLSLWDIYLQPEARAGYRYDFISDPVKLKMAFAYANITNPGAPGAGPQFQLTGPDPSKGNFVLGGSLAATSDTWTLGFNIDLVRGSNGSFEQVGSISLLGRI